MTTILHDGDLTRDEALSALRLAAQSATEYLPIALTKCETDEQKHKLVADRDIILLAYLSSLQRSLIHTGTLFEKTASDLETASGEIAQNAANLKNNAEAINLFAGLLRLATSLALAFA